MADKLAGAQNRARQHKERLRAVFFFDPAIKQKEKDTKHNHDRWLGFSECYVFLPRWRSANPLTVNAPSEWEPFIVAKQHPPPTTTKTCVGGYRNDLVPFWRPQAPHQNIDSAFLDCMYVLAKYLTYEIQSIQLTSTDFWNLYLVQMGAEIRQSVVDADTDSLLSQNWLPSTLLRHGSYKSCSETESATTDWKAWKRTEKTARNATKFLNSVDLGKVWPPLEQSRQWVRRHQEAWANSR